MTTNEITPTRDSEVVQYVRALTGYDDVTDELPYERALSLVKVTKMTLTTKAGVTPEAIYEDHGLAQALVYGVAIKAKLHVENYSVSSWSVADQSVDVSGTRSGEAPQLNEWAGNHVAGLQSSAKTSFGEVSNSLDL